ncbi:hypothetical protein HTV45_21760 [Streptomyces sp. CHD11]|uniref:hypothetical protein n=1 Tax=Streptomyces sp. CHD11 TaxID=2741325 RepID=UPI001BFC8A71|nr:hypothetical protein [Streptomyces sp. CHD11]MBT3153459.1 hypothetical protein [Streptomyces sp. CHD11]
MATPRTLTLSCSTCGGRHQHRQLTAKEEGRAKEQLGLRAVHDFWLCENVVDPATGERCRTLRRHLNEKPFPGHVKLLPPD